MSIVTASKQIFVMLTVSAALLTACTVSPYEREDAFAVGSELFSPDDFKHTLVRDGTGKMEVLHAATSNRQVSVLFLEAFQTGVLSEHATFPHLVMNGWKALQGKEIEFGVKGNAETPAGSVDFERFSYAANSCFMFHSLYEPSGYDSQGRYAKLVAGYYCQTLAAAMDDDAVARFLNSITVPKFNFVELAGEPSEIIYYEPVLPLKTRSIPPRRDG